MNIQIAEAILESEEEAFEAFLNAMIIYAESLADNDHWRGIVERLQTVKQFADNP